MVSLAVCGKWAHFSIFGSFLIFQVTFPDFLPTFTVQFHIFEKCSQVLCEPS